MRKTQQGVTLVELVVTTTIIAILLSVGVPSYRYVTVNNRVSSEVNGLLGDLQFARAEAIKQGRLVSVCASGDGKTCLGTATWSGGWLVFSDAGAVGTVDGTDQLLRVQRALAGGDTMVADTVGFGVVTFNREGFARGIPGAGVLLKLHDAKSLAQYTRCLSITVVGALSTQKYGGGCT